ncbi:MAG: hypothetical protein K0R50_2408 [Eubacterium sp.]|nr:hypothetical protein [Eubacterium sp.]
MNNKYVLKAAVYRLLLTIVISVLYLPLSGCTSIDFDIEENINPPEYNSRAVQGTWNIDGFISALPENKNVEINVENIKNRYIGQQAIFDNEIGAVGADTCVNPKYRIIITTADTFIQSKYRIDESDLGLGKQEISVVTISSDNQVFYDLIVTDDKKAYVYIDNGFLVLNKASDHVDEKLKEKSFGNIGSNVNNGQYQEDPLLRSGVLLGIRGADNTYRTLWIYSKNREIKTISSRKQLLVPRTKGFWQVGTINEININAIYAEPFVDSPLLKESMLTQPNGNMLRVGTDTKIHFVGNDYIGTETDDKFQVYSVENLREARNVKFSEINSDDTQIFQQSANDFLAALKGDEAKNVITGVNDHNYMLMRRNGHWIIKSRLYFKQPFKKKYQDFDLKLMVPSKLIHYDEMELQWNEIKSKQPWATDAFMSPNKEIVVLASENSLSIYSVQKSSIVNKQLQKIPLSKGDKVIMAEWSIGRYADIWDKFVAKIFRND